MKKRIILIAAGLLVLIAIGLGSADDHRTNAKYLGWKFGLCRYNPATALRYLNVDVRFRESLVGKTKAEVMRLFPDLRPTTKANDYQRAYTRDVEGIDFMWIGDSGWGIVFDDDGRLKEFRLMKG